LATTSGASEHRRLKLVFMGTPPFAARCLQRLLEGPHEVAAVVTRADKPRGRGMDVQPSAVKQLADTRGIEIIAPVTAKDPSFASRLRAIAPDLAAVVAYGRLLPASVLEIPPLGCINAHASLLPLLRGAAPIERAILEGHARTGVTIMRIEERMDAGATLNARSLAIEQHVDAGQLRELLADVAAELLADAVDRIARGDAHFTAQDETRATYAPPLRREESRIDWFEDAARVDCRVRAFAPSPGAFTFDGARRIKVLRGRVVRGAATAGGTKPQDLSRPSADPAPGTIIAVDAAGLTVACGSGEYSIEALQPEGKRPMSATDWARGAGKVTGRKLGEQ
jgi:methionyl-tRNA formyltransferase